MIHKMILEIHTDRNKEEKLCWKLWLSLQHRLWVCSMKILLVLRVWKLCMHIRVRNSDRQTRFHINFVPNRSTLLYPLKRNSMNFSCTIGDQIIQIADNFFLEVFFFRCHKNISYTFIDRCRLWAIKRETISQIVQWRMFFPFFHKKLILGFRFHFVL